MFMFWDYSGGGVPSIINENARAAPGEVTRFYGEAFMFVRRRVNRAIVSFFTEKRHVCTEKRLVGTEKLQISCLF